MRVIDIKTGNILTDSCSDDKYTANMILYANAECWKDYISISNEWQEKWNRRTLYGEKIYDQNKYNKLEIL